MSLASVLYSLASVPMFASRPFLAAFVTAMLARFGHDIPWLRDREVILALSRAPEWFTNGWTLFALGALAAAEVFAAKHSEVRALMHDFDGVVKSAVAVLVSLALLDKDTADTIRHIERQGLGTQGFLVAGIGALTWFAAALRRALFGFVAEIDDHDDIGLQSVLNWLENSWTVLGLLFLVVLPLVALVLSALTVLGLFLAAKAAERAEQRTKIPCAACGRPVFPHATACPMCRHPLAAPRAVGVFGQPKAKAAGDVVLHRFALVARKRCPVCATRLVKRAVQQPCPECGTVTFENRAAFESYLAALHARLPKTLLVCLGFSAIPVLGVIPGVVYYRLTLVSGLRGYVPPLRGCLARVAVRVVSWVLIAVQPIPLVGALVLPIMCFATYGIYRHALAGRAREDLKQPASVSRAT